MYKNRLYTRIDLQGSIKWAEAITSIPIKTLEDEYVRLRNFFDEHTVLKETKKILSGETSKKDNLQTAFFELRSRVNIFCESILGTEDKDQDGYKNDLRLMQNEIEKDRPSYNNLYSTQYNLLAKLRVYVNSKQVALFQENMNTLKDIRITELEKKRCVIS